MSYANKADLNIKWAPKRLHADREAFLALRRLAGDADDEIRGLRAQIMILEELLGSAADVIHNLPDEVETQEEADLLRDLKDRIADARGAIWIAERDSTASQ